MLLKSKRSPTALETYKARKQREEEEKDAFLPPGLVNHGNTCFMNSVLQGLIATPLLSDIVRFSLPQIYLPVSSRRSPQLTNGHGRGGQWEREWEQGMPLGDAFVSIMEKSWKLQDEHTRASMSPKEILARLGAKYDQYLDFRQQDAHELLRHLLDAMRMEELDIIKKRQPPQPKSKCKRPRKASQPESSASGTSHSASGEQQSRQDANNAHFSRDAEPGLATKPITEEDRLTSFVDMVFGGQLASILVCQKCKKVSCTYEDFNDLSLSIKPEDYERVRTRDRLKNLAKKLKKRPGAEFRTENRASSVPASPTRKSLDLDTVLVNASQADPRRRSLDIEEERAVLEESESTSGELEAEVGVSTGDGISKAAEEDEEWKIVVLPDRPSNTDDKNEKGKPAVDPDSIRDTEGIDEKGLVTVSPDVPGIKESRNDEKGIIGTSPSSASGKEAGKDGKVTKFKEKSLDDDSWARLGRRISVGMGLKGKNKSKSKGGQQRKEKEREKEADQKGSSQSTGSAAEPSNDIHDIKAPAPKAAHAVALAKLMGLPSPPLATAANDEDVVPSGVSLSPRPSPAPIVSSPSSHSISTDAIPIPPPMRIPSPLIRSKSPRPPKPSREETEYLRRLLADVPSHSPAPFNMFRAPLGTSSPESGTMTNLWAKLGHVQSIEECLRMFTAVEAMDGDNMVGCRRCWKIEQGLYKPRGRSIEAERAFGEVDGQSSESSDEEPGADNAGVVDLPAHTSPDPNNRTLPASTMDTTSATMTTEQQDHGVVMKDTVNTMPSSATPELPGQGQRPTPLDLEASPCISPQPLTTYGGFSIPLISTTAPESPYAPVTQSDKSDTDVLVPSADVPVESVKPLPSTRTADPLFTSTSKDSLTLPSMRRPGRRPAEHRFAPIKRGESSSPSSDESADEAESDTSMTASVCSDTSSVTSSSVRPSSDVQPLKGDQKSPSGVPRSKQVIFRRSFKRYLISTPPPVLVVHLKRFQQVGRSPVQFFANFKKLDDFVSFPEYLDLSPFLLPKKEDFGLGKKKRKKNAKSADHADRSPTKDDKCMYRLYAVVVHIGNMLGGHYIAYTALPGNLPEQSELASSTASATESLPFTPRIPSFESNTDVKGKESNTPRQWCYISDTVVRLTTFEEVLKAKAYICMYERL